MLLGKKNYRRGDGEKFLVGVVSRIQFFLRWVVQVSGRYPLVYNYFSEG